MEFVLLVFILLFGFSIYYFKSSSSKNINNKNSNNDSINNKNDKHSNINNDQSTKQYNETNFNNNVLKNRKDVKIDDKITTNEDINELELVKVDQSNENEYQVEQLNESSIDQVVIEDYEQQKNDNQTQQPEEVGTQVNKVVKQEDGNQNEPTINAEQVDENSKQVNEDSEQLVKDVYHVNETQLYEEDEVEELNENLDKESDNEIQQDELDEIEKDESKLDEEDKLEENLEQELDVEPNRSEVLFKIIWNNIYLRSKVQQHLKLFNLYYQTREFSSLEDLMNFKFKYYLRKVKFNFIVREYDNLEALLPENIESLVISMKLYQTSLPKWIKSIQVIEDQQFTLSNEEEFQPVKLAELLSNSTNLESLEFESKIVLGQLSQDVFKNSISNLKELRFPSTFPVTLLSSFLPNQLETLYIYTNEVIKQSSLPESLINLFVDTKGSVFPFEVDSFKNKSNLQVLKLKNREFDHGMSKYYNKDKSYNIPNEFKLPSSLKQLEIIGTCQFNESSFNLPSSLKTIKIQVPDMDYIKTLPSSLVNLDLGCYSEINSNLTSILPITLKSLTIRYGYFNTKIIPNMMPPRLVYLKFEETIFDNGGGDPLTEDNLFPSTLKYLDLGDTFNEPICTLPNNLKTLVLGKRYHHRIIEGAIPFNLKLLEFKNPNYDKIPIKLDNPNTIIDCRNYYKQFERNLKNLVSFVVPKEFRSSIDPEQFSLKDKNGLEYLDLSKCLTPETILLELPNVSTIKTLVLGHDSLTINLDKFPFLQTIIVGDGSTSTFKTSNFNNIVLKKIQVSRYSTDFIDNLNPLFYQFIKLN